MKPAKTATAKAEIGAALAMLGDRIRAEKVFDIAVGSLAKEPAIEIGRTDYGSPMRDAAVVVTLAAEGDAAKPIPDLRRHRHARSTPRRASMLRAIS